MTISTDQLNALLDAARAQNEYADKQAAWDRAPPSDAAPKGDRPGDYFNARGDWGEWLAKWGWKHVGGRYWKRPGKDKPGISATVGHCKAKAGHPLLYVFSSNATPFESDTSYSLFAAYAVAEHAGDFRAAAQALGEKGYGEKAERINFVYGPGGSNGSAKAPGEDATAADLIALNATIRWAWKGWIPVGVLTIFASEPGIGKTRLCADLTRRVYHGLPWPDGQPPTLPSGSPVLWVAADNQHPELGTLPTEFGFPPEVLYLNAPKLAPFGGTMLDALDDLRDFEARIARVKPALVFIDTSLNATDRSAHKPEDAKAFFVPLQRIAQRQDVPLVCVTHTNAAGKPLGRRITGQGRVVIQLANPDPENQPDRRRFWVTKSNSVFPPPLGVTMGGAGNEYDDSPPAVVDAPSGGSGGKPSRVKECADWITARLTERPRRVFEVRKEAERAGFSSKTLYAAKDTIDVAETIDSHGKKWWSMPPVSTVSDPGPSYAAGKQETGNSAGEPVSVPLFPVSACNETETGKQETAEPIQTEMLDSVVVGFLTQDGESSVETLAGNTGLALEDVTESLARLVGAGRVREIDYGQTRTYVMG